MKMNKYLVAITAAAIFAFSCDSLDVDNLNDPNRSEVLGLPAEYPNAVAGAYGSFWDATQKSQPNFPISVMAQSASMSWGNWGARDLGTIPRQQFQNNLTYNNRGVFTVAWNNLYSALGGVNGVYNAIIENDAIILDNDGNDITDQTIASIKALQGLSLGYLSLFYDQAYIIDETTDTQAVEFSPYGDVNDAAMAKLDEAIAMYAGSNYVWSDWNGLTLTGDEAAAFLRTMAAKILAGGARDLAETEAVDWNRVLAYTGSGQSSTFAPVGDGGFVWWHRLLIQGQDGGWARISQKMMKMMNPSLSDVDVPYPWPDGLNSTPELTTPDDARVTTDFVYNASVPFSAARGYYFFGNYNYGRYLNYRNGFTDPMVWLTAEENGLLRAEALVRTGGSATEIANLINATRVGRGGLAPVTGAESTQDLLNAITYERLVEFSWHASCNSWLYRRMQTPLGNTDATNLYYLEPATARHLPVPAQEMELNGLPADTYGGNAPEK